MTNIRISIHGLRVEPDVSAAIITEAFGLISIHGLRVEPDAGRARRGEQRAFQSTGSVRSPT